MERFLPGSFLEVLGASMLLAAVIAGGISLYLTQRPHALRLLAIFCITALAIFSNNVTTYFAAIFVIATAVTELEFLQNLAAIIRGNKEYFDYQKSVLSRGSKLSSLATEVEGLDETTVSGSASDNCPSEGSSDLDGFPPNTDKSEAGDESDNKVEQHAPAPINEERPTSNPPRSQADISGNKLSEKVKYPPRDDLKASRGLGEIYELEVKALDILELNEPFKIERDIKYSRGAKQVVLDGIMVNKDTGVDKIFEVRYVSSISNSNMMLALLCKKIYQKLNSYTEITGRHAFTHLVLVAEDDVVLSDRHWHIVTHSAVNQTTLMTVSELRGK